MITEKQQDEIIEQVLQDMESGVLEIEDFRARIISAVKDFKINNLPKEKWGKLFRSIKLEAGDIIKKSIELSK